MRWSGNFMDSIWFFLFYGRINQNRWHHLIFLNYTSNRTQPIKWTYSIKTEHSPGYRGCSCCPLLLSLSHSPDVTWQPISISSVVEKNGSLHCDKRTFTANTAINKSLSSNGLKRPKEACTCCVWVAEADRLTKQHEFHQQHQRHV